MPTQPSTIWATKPTGISQRNCCDNATEPTQATMTLSSVIGGPDWACAASAAKPFICSHSGLKRRLILCAAVAEHGDDGVTGAELARDARGGRDIDATGAAEEEAFLPQQPVHESHGLRILDVYGIIDRRVLEICRDSPDADTLGDRP